MPFSVLESISSTKSLTSADSEILVSFQTKLVKLFELRVHCYLTLHRFISSAIDMLAYRILAGFAKGKV